MGKVIDYTRYACDRSPKAHSDGVTPIEFLRPPDKRIDEWFEFDHTDANGVTIHYVLCPDCKAKYESVKKTWDNDFRDFIEEGF